MESWIDRVIARLREQGGRGYTGGEATETSPGESGVEMVPQESYPFPELAEAGFPLSQDDIAELDAMYNRIMRYALAELGGWLEKRGIDPDDLVEDLQGWLRSGDAARLRRSLAEEILQAARPPTERRLDKEEPGEPRKRGRPPGPTGGISRVRKELIAHEVYLLREAENRRWEDIPGILLEKGISPQKLSVRHLQRWLKDYKAESGYLW